MPPIVESSEKHQAMRAKFQKYYDNDEHKYEKQRRDLVRAIQNGKRKNVTKATLDKYHIELNPDGSVLDSIIEQLGKVTISVLPQPIVEQDVAIVPAPKKVVERPLKGATAVSTKDCKDYVKNRLNEDRVKEGQKPFAKSTMNSYLTHMNILRKLGLVKDDSEDIMPYIRNPVKTIEVMRKRISDQGLKLNSLAQDAIALMNICKYVPQVRDQIDYKQITYVYGAVNAEAQKKNTHETSNTLDQKPVFMWPKIVEAVKKKFGPGSIEYLYFKTFEEVPVRTELTDLPVNNSEAPNYVSVPAGKEPVLIQLRRFKTIKTFKEQTYTLSPALSAMIRKSLKAKPRALLFEVPKHAPEKWLRDILSEAGYPQFPHPTEEENKDVKVFGGMRHTLISYRNSIYNTKGELRGGELADKMLHSLGQAKLSYQNARFVS